MAMVMVVAHAVACAMAVAKWVLLAVVRAMAHDMDCGVAQSGGFWPWQ